MKLRIISVALVLSSLLFAARANDILQVTETGENFSGIQATLNGAPVSITLTGAADNWTIEFPIGYALNKTSSSILLGDPEAAPGPTFSLINTIDITQPTFMLWTSDIVSNVGSLNPVTIPDAGTDPSGRQVDLVLADSPRSVPDASSTFSLLGTALAGLVWFGVRRNAVAR
jgi:hypothetical protein